MAAHPDENVIVLTHSYLEADGSISQSNGGYGATSPQYLYDNLIKVYPNIKFVLSGHVGISAVPHRHRRQRQQDRQHLDAATTARPTRPGS